MGERIKVKPIAVFLKRGGIAILLIMIWSYQLVHYYASPQRYVEKFGTEWMKVNYLTGWSSGFGVNEALELLSHERNKYVFVDPQWGNPGTAIQVYARSHPTLRIMPLPLNQARLLDTLPQNSAVLVFRYRPNSWWDDILKLNICRNRNDIKIVEDQQPLIVCRN